MNTHANLTRLYEACGFILKNSMATRLVGAGDPDHFVGIAGPTLQNGTGHLRSNNSVAHERKLWRAKKIAYALSFLPFVRAIAVCNSLALHMVHEDSDIDLFIVAAPGRVWSARFWVTGALAVARMRPGEARLDPVCVSFFIDESTTNLAHLEIERDIYFLYWMRSLLPLFGAHPLFESGAHTPREFRITHARAATLSARAFEFCARLIPENFLFTQQKKIMPSELLAAAEKNDTSVVLSEKIIKLHLNDRRAEIRDKVFGTNIQ